MSQRVCEAVPVTSQIFLSGRSIETVLLCTCILWRKICIFGCVICGVVSTYSVVETVRFARTGSGNRTQPVEQNWEWTDCQVSPRISFERFAAARCRDYCDLSTGHIANTVRCLHCCLTNCHTMSDPEPGDGRHNEGTSYFVFRDKPFI